MKRRVAILLIVFSLAQFSFVQLGRADVFSKTGKVIWKGLEKLFFGLPNQIGGATAAGFEFIGRQLDRADRPEDGKIEKKPLREQDPLPIREDPLRKKP